MSIGICFDDDDYISHLDNLLNKKDAENAKLKSAIYSALSYNSKTADDYMRVANLALDTGEKIEFLGKASGLLEANKILRRYLKQED